MNESKVTINVPDGWELVQTGESKWELQKIGLPKTWEKFCETHPVRKGECYINRYSELCKADSERKRLNDCDKDMLPDQDTAEAVLALCQLLQLQDLYNGDWKPDWTDKSWKSTIVSCSDILNPSMSQNVSQVLVFKSDDLRDQFLRNFRDLIEIAKPLL